MKMRRGACFVVKRQAAQARAKSLIFPSTGTRGMATKSSCEFNCVITPLGDHTMGRQGSIRKLKGITGLAQGGGHVQIRPQHAHVHPGRPRRAAPGGGPYQGPAQNCRPARGVQLDSLHITHCRLGRVTCCCCGFSSILYVPSPKCPDQQQQPFEGRTVVQLNAVGSIGRYAGAVQYSHMPAH